MTAIEIDKLIDNQKKYFQSGATFPVSFRIDMLKRLKAAVIKYEEDIAAALHGDLGKSPYESYMCETGMVLSELSFLIKNTKKFAKTRRVRTPLSQFASRSYSKPVPYGNTLIISPWNYPFLLTLGPLADAIAAGNTAIIKPSEFSTNTVRVVDQILTECFPKEYITMVMGGIEESSYLLSKKFDFVFFTGSQAVGKVVLRSTAEHLTPAVLELGGKSPVIVDSTAKVPLAAKRIVFGKIINCGQTCVAPDYVLCQKSIKDELVKEIIVQIKQQLGDDPLSNPNYGHIINQRHFARIYDLIDQSKVVYGGHRKEETLQIAPTVMDHVTFEDAVMQEEIFGPILPILTFDKFEEVYEMLKDKPKPLALYLFSEDKEHIDFIIERVHFGGGCVNDTIIHLATHEMGFGGVGESGMGSYHGKFGFDAFSHIKSIVDKKTWIDLPMRYQPYKDSNDKLVRMFLK